MVTKDGAKMSKSRGNVVSPASIVERVGADTARCYILFVGPPDQDADWSDAGVEGVHRFLGRLWRLAAETAERTNTTSEDFDVSPSMQGDDLALLRKTHWAIDKVSGDLRRFAFNTAIAAVMELLNDCSRLRDSVEAETLRFALATAASLLFPFAPHVCADVYERLTGARVWEAAWPHAEEALLECDSYELVCQVNGKLRDRVQAGANADSRRAQGAVPASPPTCRRTSTARRSSRRSSCRASSSTWSCADGRAEARLPDPRRRPRCGGGASRRAACTGRSNRFRSGASSCSRAIALRRLGRRARCRR